MFLHLCTHLIVLRLHRVQPSAQALVIRPRRVRFDHLASLFYQQLHFTLDLAQFLIQQLQTPGGNSVVNATINNAIFTLHDVVQKDLQLPLFALYFLHVHSPHTHPVGPWSRRSRKSSAPPAVISVEARPTDRWLWRGCRKIDPRWSRWRRWSGIRSVAWRNFAVPSPGQRRPKEHNVWAKLVLVHQKNLSPWNFRNFKAKSNHYSLNPFENFTVKNNNG